MSIDVNELDILADGPAQHSQLLVEFYLDHEHQPFASEKAGYPVFEPKEKVKITHPGGSEVHCAYVAEKHIREYPRQYRRFKQGLEQAVDGTPVEQWPAATPGEVKLCKHGGVLSVEQLSVLDDTAIGRLGPIGLSLRKKAADWLAARSDQSVVVKQTAEIDRLKEDLAATKAEIAELLDELKRTKAKKGD
jgi:hypothetical protein